MTTSLTFQNKTLSVINQQNQIWLSALEIGEALAYSHPIQNVTKLYDRHSEEFTPNMTALIDMRTNGGMQKVRIFSLRGCHLIGMLSHTKVAKDFRKWVLDILDQEIERQQQPQQLALPEPNPEICLDKKQIDSIKSYIEFSQEFAVDVDRTLCRFLSSLGIDITLATPDCNYGRVITNANKISTFAQRIKHQLDQAISQI